MKNRFTTPQILWIAVAAIAGCAVCLMGLSLWAVGLHKDALNKVAIQAAPSIIAAQKMRAALSDMDANVANELLLGAGSSDQAIKAYETRRKEVGDSLVLASENVTFGDAERVPLQMLASGLSKYERQVQRARDLMSQDREASHVAYREAEVTMTGTLLKAAENLDQANRNELDKGYAELRAISGTSRAIVLLAGAALLAVLAWIQMFLTSRTRRLLNPLLLGAMVVAAGFLVYTISALSAGESELKLVKDDAFDSIHALWRTMAVAYDANADESRFLLDPANADAAESDFASKSRLIAAAPEGMTYGVLISGKALPAEFKGLLADELRNITFDGERDAAIDSLRTWTQYLDIDKRIRELNRAGKTKEAVALCIGTQQGESNWAFDRFEAAVRKTININQAAFDTSVENGFRRLSGFGVVAPLSAALIAILAYFGLIVRIREYTT